MKLGMQLLSAFPQRAVQEILKIYSPEASKNKISHLFCDFDEIWNTFSYAYQ